MTPEQRSAVLTATQQADDSYDRLLDAACAAFELLVRVECHPYSPKVRSEVLEAIEILQLATGSSPVICATCGEFSTELTEQMECEECDTTRHGEQCIECNVLIVGTSRQRERWEGYCEECKDNLDAGHTQTPEPIEEYDE